MAKVTLLEVSNVSRIFGKTEYALFTAQTEDKHIIECGISYNCLESKQFDTDNLDALIGCQVITKEYTDSQTGEIVNPEDSIQNVLDGTYSVCLFNKINCTIKKSELFIQQQRELIASTNAKAKVEFQKEKKAKALQASLDRLRAKALALSTENLTPVDKLEDSVEDVEVVENEENELSLDEKIPF